MIWIEGLRLVFLLILTNTIVAQVNVEYSPDLPGSDLGAARIKEALIQNGYKIKTDGDKLKYILIFYIEKDLLTAIELLAFPYSLEYPYLYSFPIASLNII